MFNTWMLKAVIILGIVSVFSSAGYAKPGVNTSGYKFTDSSELGDKCNCVNQGGEWCTATLCCMPPSSCCGEACCEESDECCGDHCCAEDTGGCCEDGCMIDCPEYDECGKQVGSHKACSCD